MDYMKTINGFPALSKSIFKIVTKNRTLHAFGVGDCLNVINAIPKGSVDLIITDPPYNRDIDYGATYKDRMNDGIYAKYINDRIEKSIELLKDTGSMYIVTYPELAVDLFIALRSKMVFKNWLTWHYPTNIGHSKNKFTRSQRAILFYTKTKTNKYVFNRNEALMPYKNPTDKRIAKLIENGSKGRMAYDAGEINERIQRDDFIEMNLFKNIGKNRQRWHKCQLPLELLSFFIRVSSKRGGLVFDPFAGTFSLNKVSCDLERNSIGIDLNPRYRELGLKRIKG